MKFPPLSEELFEFYPSMSAQSHQHHVEQYALKVVRAARATETTAPLRSAVPDMLEMLKYWESMLVGNIGPLKGQLEMVRAVIAKAERQPIDVIDEVAAERREHIADGRDAEHDDLLGSGELALAAASYACNDPLLWPWSMEWWKPKDKRRNYIRAAALLVAEIEKLDRKAGSA